MKKVTLKINPENKKSHINPEIYGHFSEHLGRCIYNGIYVGEDSTIPNLNGVRTDVINALKNIKIPVLRWPGGCFADEYHWKDGIGEKSERKRMINTNWGAIVEDNSFGTHEFMNLCEQLDCQPYIAGNLGSGTVQELAEWVEYMTSDDLSPMANLRRKNGRDKAWRLKYLGIGNESWGCGGNMRPEYYCDLYKQYQTFCKNYSGNELFKVACGPNADDYNWTKVLMSNVGDWQMKAISLHYYTVPTGDWSNKGSATDFSDEEYYKTISSTLKMEELVSRHSEIMDKYDPEHRIGLIVDEWGCWYDVEEGTNPGFLYQQNTMRDAVVAAVNLNIFNSHSDRVIMANLAQVVNVLQAVILTEGEQMLLTPTYHVFDLYKSHQDGDLLESECENFVSECAQTSVETLSQSVSAGQDGSILITMSNCSLSESVLVTARLNGFVPTGVKGRIITSAPNACNTFDCPDNVTPKDFDDVSIQADTVAFEMPPCSVISIRLFK